MLDDIDRAVAPESLLTHLIVPEIRAAREAEGEYERAFPTYFRNSDAGKCSRLLAFKLLEIEPSDPFDAASDWSIWLGQTIHDALQAALLKRFPEATVEKPVLIGWRDEPNLTSGHLDFYDPHRTFELKSINAMGFDTAVGINRQRFSQSPKGPAGPRATALLQGSLNAYGTGSLLLVIGYLALENYSVGLAEKLGLGELDRFVAEWHFLPEVFTPIAERELERLYTILQMVKRGFLPVGEVVTEDEPSVRVSSHRNKLPWQCAYCSHLGVCRQWGDEIVPIPVELQMKAPA